MTADPMTLEEARAVITEHRPATLAGGLVVCAAGCGEGPCLPYRLAAAYVAASEERDQANATVTRIGCSHE